MCAGVCAVCVSRKDAIKVTLMRSSVRIAFAISIRFSHSINVVCLLAQPQIVICAVRVATVQCLC